MAPPLPDGRGAHPGQLPDVSAGIPDHFGPGSLPLYASKAASFKQMYRIMAEEGMGVDVVSSGELYTALSAGFPAERIYFHGNCKTDADLAYGVSQGIGFFVADNREELLVLEKTGGRGQCHPEDPSAGNAGH